MTMNSGIAIVLALSLLGGCASFENRTSAEKFVYTEDEKQTAVVILSVGAVEQCISFVTRLKLMPAGAFYNGTLLASLPVDSYVVKSEFTEHHGYMHVELNRYAVAGARSAATAFLWMRGL